MKLTLEEIDAIYKNKTEYHIVFYKDDKEFRQVREDIDKARSLFMRTVADLYHIDNPSIISRNWLTIVQQNYYKVSLFEVCPNKEPIAIAGYGVESDEDMRARWKVIYDKEREEAQRKREEERANRSYKNLMEFMGTSVEEYKESITNFAAMHGTTPDKWGIKV